MSKENTPITTKRRKSSIRRKAIMLAIGSGLGLFCRFAPVEHQEACHWAARVIAIILGSP